MRVFIIPALAISLLALSFGACKSSSNGAKTFCDTACLKDSIKFTGEQKLKPYVYISASNCMADTITWSYSGMGVNKKESVSYFAGREVHLNRDFVKCFFKDTAYALLEFNDCATGRGYQLKLPYNNTATIGRKSSAINNIDPKFSIPDNMLAYTDRGNIFVEEMATGKIGQLTFGKALEIDYDAIHETIDSVNITPERIWAKVKIDNKWTVLEKKSALK
jgi:hypothetical protein